MMITKVGIFVVILSFIGVLLSCGNEDETNQKIVFMDSAKVFEGFQMKKDYDEMMKADMSRESALVDSLTVLLNRQFEATDSLQVHKLRKDYYVAEQIFNAKFEKLSAQYTSEVNDRLNEYIKDYSKDKGYSIVLGSGGQGNVMYVADEDNITEDLVKFINEKYTK